MKLTIQDSIKNTKTELMDLISQLLKIKNSCSHDSPGDIEREVAFTENGENVIQKDSYNDEKGETTLRVPAHGNYKAVNIIMQKDTRKMIVSSKDECMIEDVPDMINPDQIIYSDGSEALKKGQHQEKIIHRVHSRTKIATINDQEVLTESMKKECAGKAIKIASVQTIDDDEFEMENDFKDPNAWKKLKKLKRNARVKRQGCG